MIMILVVHGELMSVIEMMLDRQTDPDMIFVKKFTRPQFWKQEFYAKNA